MIINKYFEDLDFFKKLINKEYPLDAENINVLVNILSNRAVYCNMNWLSNLYENLSLLIKQIKNQSENLDIYINSTIYSLNNLRNELIQNIKFNVYCTEDTSTLDFKKIIKKNKNVNIIDFKEGQKHKEDYKFFNVNIGILTKNEYIKTNDNFDIIFTTEDLYTDLSSKFQQNFVNSITSHYDYNYLKSSIEYYKSIDNPSIILGNSYAQVGIHNEIINDEAINFALASQDIYFSYSILKHLLKVKKPERVYLSICDFTLYHDLSLNENEKAKNLIQNVYYPILKDKRNYKYEIETNNDYSFMCKDNIILQYIIDYDKSISSLKSKLFNCNNYFNEYRPYKCSTMPYGIEFLTRDTKVRNIFAASRAHDHGRLTKYEKTRIENKEVLDNFISLCSDNNIELIVIKFPHSTYYNELHNKNMRDEIYTEVNMLKSKYDFKFIDLNNFNVFNDFDFLDFDHLSETGAIKASKIIKSQLDQQ